MYTSHHNRGSSVVNIGILNNIEKSEKALLRDHFVRHPSVCLLVCPLSIRFFGRHVHSAENKFTKRKKEAIWLSPVTKAPTPTEKSKKQRDNTFIIVYWCFTSHAPIFQSYMWRHRCAGGLKKKQSPRSGSQRHRHSAGFFNVPVLHRHGTTLFIRGFRHTAPIRCLLRHAGDTEDVFST